MFRSYDHPQGAYFVPYKSYSLKTLSDLHRHAICRATHIRSQAHSEQYTTHTIHKTRCHSTNSMLMMQITECFKL